MERTVIAYVDLEGVLHSAGRLWARSELQTSQPYPNKNSNRDDLVKNADGSVDLYIGPTSRKELASNCSGQILVHMPSALRAARTVVRDKTWKPSEIELVK